MTHIKNVTPGLLILALAFGCTASGTDSKSALGSDGEHEGHHETADASVAHPGEGGDDCSSTCGESELTEGQLNVLAELRARIEAMADVDAKDAEVMLRLLLDAELIAALEQSGRSADLDATAKAIAAASVAYRSTLHGLGVEHPMIDDARRAFLQVDARGIAAVDLFVQTHLDYGIAKDKVSVAITAAVEAALVFQAQLSEACGCDGKLTDISLRVRLLVLVEAMIETCTELVEKGTLVCGPDVDARATLDVLVELAAMIRAETGDLEEIAARLEARLQALVRIDLSDGHLSALATARAELNAMVSTLSAADCGELVADIVVRAHAAVLAHLSIDDSGCGTDGHYGCCEGPALVGATVQLGVEVKAAARVLSALALR